MRACVVSFALGLLRRVCGVNVSVLSWQSFYVPVYSTTDVCYKFVLPTKQRRGDDECATNHGRGAQKRYCFLNALFIVLGSSNQPLFSSPCASVATLSNLFVLNFLFPLL